MPRHQQIGRLPDVGVIDHAWTALPAKSGQDRLKIPPREKGAERVLSGET